jgi:hypothetical protein
VLQVSLSDNARVVVLTDCGLETEGDVLNRVGIIRDLFWKRAFGSCVDLGVWWNWVV